MWSPRRSLNLVATLTDAPPLGLREDQSVMSLWLMMDSPNMTQMSWWRRNERRMWRLVCLSVLPCPHLLGSPLCCKALRQDGPPDDQDSQSSKESTDENPPQNLDVNEDELLGPAMDISIPERHSDDSVALVIPPEVDNLL